jgi:signal transduction histidine kinase
MSRDSRLAWALLGLATIIAVAGAVMTVMAWPDLKPADVPPAPITPVGAVVYATLGALIVRRVGSRIGWMLLLEGIGLSLMCATSLYAIIGVVTRPGSLPAAKVVGTLSEVVFIPIVVGLVFVLLLFPTGLLPSPRWRPVAAAALALTSVSLVGFVVSPRLVALPAPGGVSLQFPNPFALRTLSRGSSTALFGTVPMLTLFSVVLFAMAMLALVLRYRSGGSDVRQQVKWLALAALAAVVSQVALALAWALAGDQAAVTVVAGLASALVALVGIPAAITIAILKYGLYQIDVIINRAVVYGLLAAVVTAVYLVVVVGIGSLIGYGFGSPVLTTAAAVAVALLFQPVRHQAQRVANRVVYGERATPYQVLSDFAEHMAGTLGLDEMLDRMVTVLAEGTGATRVDVWIRVGDELRPASTWPRDSVSPEAIALGHEEVLPSFDHATRAIAVRQGDELLGALAIQKPRNEALSTTEDKLLQDLASQAGLVLRNVRLTAELRNTIEQLRASRRRLVEAQNSERRKIERNIHDGAQQQLVALKLQLGLMDRMAGDPERVRGMALQLQDALQHALDDLRDLARGIYPPLLADQGLAAALAAQAQKAAVSTTVLSDGIGRYSEEVESAVYFCALEAMQNVAKYAGATATVVRLGETDGFLHFEVEDDGRGFDAERTGYGTGLQGMADRLDAIGGVLEVTSEPARGTLVRGRIRLG